MTNTSRSEHQPTHEEYSAQFLAAAIVKVADRLRYLADSVERLAADAGPGMVGKPGHPSYASVAQAVQHVVLWDVANLNLDALTTRAYDADNGRLTARTATLAAALTRIVDDAETAINNDDRDRQTILEQTLDRLRGLTPAVKP